VAARRGDSLNPKQRANTALQRTGSVLLVSVLG
jgi:hypothetical protein